MAKNYERKMKIWPKLHAAKTGTVGWNTFMAVAESKESPLNLCRSVPEGASNNSTYWSNGLHGDHSIQSINSSIQLNVCMTKI